MTKEYSPFTPGRPVPVEFFVGRINEIERVLAAAKKSKEQKTIETLFVYGERGIGKSSLCRFGCRVAEKDLSILGLHVFLGGVSSLEEMARRIFERLLNESIEKPWFESVKRFLGNHVRQVGLFGLSVEFDASDKDLSRAISDFAPALRNLLKQMEKEWKGIILVLDDLNGLAAKAEFGQWLKSFVDEVATGREALPLTVILVGLKERRHQLVEHQPSLDRVFDLIPINRFSEEETRTFYRRAFAKVGVSVTKEAENLFWRFSGGFPVFMHEIGDSAFKVDEDNNITERDALNGIFLAAQVIGAKYIEPKVLDAIRSQQYREILRKVTTEPFEHRFSRQEIGDRLTSSQRKVFDNFLRRMRELGVIRADQDRGRGSYEFTSELHALFFWLQAAAEKAGK